MLACLPACLLACLPACLLACLPACCCCSLLLLAAACCSLLLLAAACCCLLLLAAACCCLLLLLACCRCRRCLLLLAGACCCFFLPACCLLLLAAACCCFFLPACCLLLLAASSCCCCCCFLLLLLPLVQTFCGKRKYQSRSPCLALAGGTGGRSQRREGMFLGFIPTRNRWEDRTTNFLRAVHEIDAHRSNQIWLRKTKGPPIDLVAENQGPPYPYTILDHSLAYRICYS